MSRYHENEEMYPSPPRLDITGSPRFERLRVYLFEEGASEFFGNANDWPYEGHFQVYKRALMRVRTFQPHEEALYKDWLDLSYRDAVNQGKRSQQLNYTQLQSLAHAGDPAVYIVSVLEEARLEHNTYKHSRGATDELQNTFAAHALFTASVQRNSMAESIEYTHGL